MPLIVDRGGIKLYTNDVLVDCLGFDWILKCNQNHFYFELKGYPDTLLSIEDSGKLDLKWYKEVY